MQMGHSITHFMVLDHRSPSQRASSPQQLQENAF